MRLKKTQLKFKDLGTAPFAIETSPEHIRLHTITLAVGKRGSGKSFFSSNLLGWLPIDRTIIVSPTYESNYGQFKHLGIEDGDKLDPDDPSVVEKIISKVEAERDELLEYQSALVFGGRSRNSSSTGVVKLCYAVRLPSAGWAVSSLECRVLSVECRVCESRRGAGRGPSLGGSDGAVSGAA